LEEALELEATETEADRSNPNGAVEKSEEAGASGKDAPVSSKYGT